MRILQAKESYYKEAPKAREIIELSKDDHNDTENIFCEIDSNLTLQFHGRDKTALESTKRK